MTVKDILNQQVTLLSSVNEPCLQPKSLDFLPYRNTHKIQKYDVEVEISLFYSISSHIDLLCTIVIRF